MPHKHKMLLLRADRPSAPLVYNREYACHQAVMAATNGVQALWVDLARSTEPPLLRVLTAANLSVPAGWSLSGQAVYPAESVQNGEELTFRLKCNPVVRREGKRFAVWTGREEPREQLVEAWFKARSEVNGFEVSDCAVLDIGWIDIHRTKDVHAQSPVGKVSFAVATILGRLRVTNANLFARALLNGIGPQKSFGCGLLLVKRYSNGEYS